jgi:hypothetical protein
MRTKKFTQNFGLETSREERPNVNGRTITERILPNGCDGVDWIQLAQGREQWRVFLKTVMNLSCTSYRTGEIDFKSIQLVRGTDGTKST